MQYFNKNVESRHISRKKKKLNASNSSNKYGNSSKCPLVVCVVCSFVHLTLRLIYCNYTHSNVPHVGNFPFNILAQGLLLRKRTFHTTIKFRAFFPKAQIISLFTFSRLFFGRQIDLFNRYQLIYSFWTYFNSSMY